MSEHLVTTDKKRFVHRRKDGEENTVCGAMPAYYHGHGLHRITEEQARTMHPCKRCYPPPSPKRLAAHLKKKCDAAIIMHRPDESGDDVIATLQADGWTLGETEIVEGKRVRYMHPPEGNDATDPSSP